ncbi:hypothetical protein Emed_007048 [Eimeria media]
MEKCEKIEPQKAASDDKGPAGISVEEQGSNAPSLGFDTCEKRNESLHCSEPPHKAKQENASACRTATELCTKIALLPSSLQEERKSSFSGDEIGVLKDLSPAPPDGTDTKPLNSSLLPHLGDAKDTDNVPCIAGSESFLPMSPLTSDWKMQNLSSGGATGAFENPAAEAHKRTGCELTGALVTSSVPLIEQTNNLALSHREVQQEQGQKRLPRALERPMQSWDSCASSIINSSIILTALRRHLRSLMRIMYAKLPFFTPTEQKPSGLIRLRGSTHCEEKQSHCQNPSGLEDRQSCSGSLPLPSGKAWKRCWSVAGYDSKRRFMKEPSRLDYFVRGSMSFASFAQRGFASPPSTHSLILPRTPVVDTFQEKECSVDDAAFKNSRRRTQPESSDVAGAVLSGPCVAAVLAQSWEGQCLFHNDNLLVCPLSELCDYLCIFLPFLGMSFAEVSAQHPSKLQHVRLQLLMLRNKQQRQPQLSKHSRHLMQRRWPLVQGVGSTGSGCHSRQGTVESSHYEAQSAALFSSGTQRPSGQAIVSGTSENSSLVPNHSLTSSLPGMRRDFTGGESLAAAAEESTGERDTPPVGNESSGYDFIGAGGGGRASTTHALLTGPFFPASSVDAFTVDSPTCNEGCPRGTSCSGVTAAGLPKDVVAGRPPVSSTNGSACVLPSSEDSCAVAAPEFAAKDRQCLLHSSRFTVSTKTATVSSASIRWHPSAQAFTGARLPSFLESGGAAPSPEELGVIIPSDKLSAGRSQRGNVQVTFSPQMGAWVVWCANGLMQQSRAFPIVTLGFEGAKRTAQQYATYCEAQVGTPIAAAAVNNDEHQLKQAILLPQCYGLQQLVTAFVGRRQCSSKRALDRVAAGSPGHGLSQDGEGAHRLRKETSRRSGSAVIPIPQVTLGLAGPAGLQLISWDLSLFPVSFFDWSVASRQDFSASRVARLSRRAMELPYVHGVRFEAANFAWVAQMRGEARRFLVKKHGFMKSRLCAIEKVEMWRAALSPEALANELKAEQDVLAMVPTTFPQQTNPDATLPVEDPAQFRCQRKAPFYEDIDQDKFAVGVKKYKAAGMGKAKGTDMRILPEADLLQQRTPLAATQPLCGHLNIIQVQGQELLQQAQQQLVLQLPEEPFVSPIVPLLPGIQKKLVASLQQPLPVPPQTVSTQDEKQQMLIQNFGTSLPLPLT